MSIVYDPVSLNAASGTEQMLRGLEQRLDPSLLKSFSIGRAIMLFPKDETTRIYWTHNLPGQMGIKEVQEHVALHVNNRWNFVEKVVFVSDWQKQRYNQHFKFSEEDQSRFTVLRNAIVPIQQHDKPKNVPIRLIYMSVPERGLGLLYDVFEKIAPHYDIELYVFSSYKIYGIPNHDVTQRQVLDKVKAHPKIRYFGSVSNDVIRMALQGAHIFAYPSTFLETSCISLIEAMSAGCLCVHSDIAALPETAAGYTNMYPYDRAYVNHHDTFKTKLEESIHQVIDGRFDPTAQKQYTDNTYSWNNRVLEWETYLKSML